MTTATSDWARRVATPWAEFEAAGVGKLEAMEGHTNRTADGRSACSVEGSCRNRSSISGPRRWQRRVEILKRSSRA